MIRILTKIGKLQDIEGIVSLSEMNYIPSGADSLLLFGIIFCVVRLVLTALDVKSKTGESFKFSKDYHFGLEVACGNKKC